MGYDPCIIENYWIGLGYIRAALSVKTDLSRRTRDIRLVSIKSDSIRSTHMN